MQFNSLSYIVFLAAVVGVYYLLPLSARKLLLLGASFAFYAAWNAKYLLLMWAVIGITWAGGLLITKWPERKKLALFLSLAGSFSLLIYFKYFNFLINSLNRLFSASFSALDIILPVGISFYVFQAAGYVIDVYRGRTECETNPVNYALFISFFPQLVAGPIERSGNMLGQLKTKQAFSLENIKHGATLILIGLVQKVVIADRLAVFVTNTFDNFSRVSSFSLLTAVFFFAFQIYCDFNAYSMIAQGSARLMGYRLMTNFRRPYLSHSVPEFWRRWHISLSSWFSDYLYIPLGGSRRGKGRTYINLLIVFLVSGLWHGAAFTFIIWGLINGLYNAGQRFLNERGRLKGKESAKKGLAGVIFTFILIDFSWIFFRAESVGRAFGYIKCLFTNFGPAEMSMVSLAFNKGDLILSFRLIFILLACQIYIEKIHPITPLEEVVDSRSVLKQGVIYAVLFLALVVIGEYGVNYVENPFIYFQF